MLKFSKQIILIAIILFAIPVFSQNKKALQGKREQIEKDIKYTNKLLEKTKKNKEKSLAYLRVLSKQLKNREELLQMLNIEIGLIEKQIGKTTIKIAENQTIIEEKKKELKKLRQFPYTIIFFVSPQKINKVLKYLKIFFHDRSILIAREMTKVYEESFYTDLHSVNREKINLKEKGEYVIILAKDGYEI